MSVPEFKFKGQPLSQESMALIGKLIISAEQEVELEKDETLKNEFLRNLIVKRFEVYDLKFKITNFFFIASLITFVANPGKAMIMLWLAFNYWKKTNKEVLGIKEWCEVFAWGTPSEEELLIMWDSQKAPKEPSGNMLDNKNYWVNCSIQESILLA